MARRSTTPSRGGTILPLLAISLIGVFGFVGLAVDLGLLAVSRTQSQNAADAASLAGCRVLNNKPGTVNNDLPAAVAAARATVLTNSHLAQHFATAEIQKIEAGQYVYDGNAQRFNLTGVKDVTTSQSVTPATAGSSWTGIRVTLSVTQPTFFMKVFGVNSMPSGATATAVFRPRDIAFVLDMTGSMAYASQFNPGTTTSTNTNRSLNPDTMVPSFGHYSSITGMLTATANLTNSDGEAFSRNNFSITTPGGPPILRGYFFDPTNVSSPSTPALPLTLSGGAANLKRAFHRWSPPESGGNATNYVGVTYNFNGYNAFHNGTEADPKGPTPAPTSFGTMTDSGTITYVGDRYRRVNGAINKTSTDWTGATTRAAAHAAELLGYNVSGGNIRRGTSGSTVIASEAAFRDPVWEQYGYDLDIAAYRTWKTNSNSELPGATGSFSTLLPAADRFYGYSMGPGYWGKTFYAWPPDPRFDTSANLTSPNATRPGFDTTGKAMCDWRRHFFTNNGSAFDPQTTNVNQVLLKSTSSGSRTLANSTSTWAVNYAAVLKWLKTGPQVLPPNLRAGRVLYYSSIPDDVNTGTGTTEQRRDKAFWKNYIDYVVGYGFTSSAFLYGPGDSWGTSPWSVYTSALSTWKGPSSSWTSLRPYMRYNDSPQRPRMHFWFGPLSMADFIANAGGNTSRNWNPGTCTEAQCWQLKAGINSVIDDIRNNHPNDNVGLAMFSYGAHNDIRVAMGQSYTRLKNALFFPKELLTAIDGGDLTSEKRPYTTSGTSLSSVPGDEIPNANGSTDPNTGLMLAYNLLSPSADLPSQYGAVRGRRGASKLVIFETDGVPNSYTNATLNLKGYNTYYSGITTGGSPGNGSTTAINRAVTVTQQICKPTSTSGTSGDSGHSLPNAPARVYPIAFGDLFDTALAPDADFRDTALGFLADIAYAGNTGTQNATTLPDYQIITGPYTQRIDRLRDCMERIFQSGVAVTLIE